ncbi:MAG: DegT/DnrJ/EryC1/StrS family aminotransferase [Pseudomonadales bacterium]|nr:DegT/DnrJ/EryC1/StrS family aminotransferase [Pseudomonadales bacterium]
MKFIDLATQYALHRDRIDRRIKDVLEHGQYIMGPEVFALEEKLAAFVGVNYCIGVSSGTDALLISLMSLDIRAGDEVIVPAFSFIATAEAVALLGAIPVFVDIDPNTYNISPALIKQAINDKTKAIIAVSLYGQCANFTEICAIASNSGIPVIEDGAQSFGATHHGKKSCSLSTLGCTSFFPSKPLGCYGDGGAIFTNDKFLADEIRKIRIHGQEERYHHSRLGINGRLDTIQAAVLLEKLAIFEDEIKKRQQIASLYTERFKRHRPDIKTPTIKKGNTSVFAQYTIEIDNREQLTGILKSKGIPTAIHYPLPLHKQPAFNSNQVTAVAAESSATKVLSLPMHPYLTSADIELITNNLMDT